MKRIECFLAAGLLFAAVANASAAIPEQVRIETGLLAGTAPVCCANAEDGVLTVRATAIAILVPA